MSDADSLSITPLPQALGATVKGLTVGDQISPAVIERLRKAWYEHLVLFFPGLHLTDEQQILLGSQFGELAAISREKDDNRTYLKTKGKVLILDNIGGGVRHQGGGWHSDVSFTGEPPLGSLASLRVCPKVGGDTMWSNQYLAYETLSPAIQTMIADLKAEHGTPLTGKAIHPVVLRHSETGRLALYVNPLFTSRIVGFTALESRGILRTLFDHMEQPHFHIRWKWQAGDAVLWDNRCTTHYAINDYTEPRALHRVTIYKPSEGKPVDEEARAANELVG